jgi:hypothetical protein
MGVGDSHSRLAFESDAFHPRNFLNRMQVTDQTEVIYRRISLWLGGQKRPVFSVLGGREAPAGNREALQ